MDSAAGNAQKNGGSVPVGFGSSALKFEAYLKGLGGEQLALCDEEHEWMMRSFNSWDLVEPKCMFRDYFMIMDQPLSEEEERMRREMRLKILGAAGSCKTIRFLTIIYRPDVFVQLLASEWEALFQPMKSNPVLESVVFDMNAAGFEAVYPHLIDLCACNRTLKKLVLGGTDRAPPDQRRVPATRMVTAAALAEIATGFLANILSPTLEVLMISGWREPNVAKHLGDLIRSAPELRELHLKETGALDDDAVEALLQGLKHSSGKLGVLSLEEVEMGDRPDFLVRACENSGASELWLVGELDRFVPASAVVELLSSNLPSLKILRLLWQDSGSGSRHTNAKILECLRHNTTLQHLDLSGCLGLDGDAFRKLVQFNVLANPSLETIELEGTTWAWNGRAALLKEAMAIKKAEQSPTTIVV